MKKIVQIIPYSYHIHTGGLEKIAQTLSDGFNAKQDVSCINIASDVRRGYKHVSLQDYSDTLFVPSFDLVYNFPFPKLWKRDFWQILQKIKERKPDIIQTHTRFFLQSFIGGLVAKWLSCTRIHVEHGSGFVIGYAWYIKICAWLFDWTFGLWIFRQCDQIVTISQVHKRFIKRFTSKEPLVIYNPIDYQPKIKVKNRVPHIGFLASLLPRKGCDILIKALYCIQDLARTCTVVGDGSERLKLEKLTKELGLDARIKFVGADDRSDWLHTFDIFVNPSHQEGLPTTAVEALLANCIVVATDVGGTKEISDKDDFILTKPVVPSIQKGLRKALNSLGKSGKSHDFVKKKFGVKESIECYMQYVIKK